MSLAATVIDKVRVNNPDFDKNEHRMSEYGALNFFYEQSRRSPLLTEEMKRKAIESAGQTLQIPVINFDGTVSVSNSRSCTVSDAENTSALVDITFKTYFIGFTIVPTMYSNNSIDMEKDMAVKLRKCARALGAALDADAIAVLEAAKTQVFAESLLYDTTNDEVEATWEQRENVLGDIDPIMYANDFVGTLHIIGNVGVRSLLNDLQKHMEYNEYNNALQWADKYFHYSNRLTNENDIYATFYAVEEGNVDMLFRYDRETALSERIGEAIRGAGDHTWEVINMPYLNIPVGLHYYEAVGDQSSIAGDTTADLTCARKQFYGFSVDVAFVVAYNSDATTMASPIVKATIESGSSFARPVSVVGVVQTQEVTP